ncbi:anti-sigma T factor NepR [Brevundimonas sp. Root1279]|uniref:anti-sigma T factor NepR n=1 Tax=Brevundimonas sp. Root1279 TaxID=1736443 RepID=UPI0009E961F0|nr:NepR family anti-sigma factor [Brevundimonas sp. Root1279]
MTDNPNPSRKAAPPTSGAALEEARLRQQAIGVKLRHMFDEVVNEPVPDEFLEILRRADERSSGKKA